MSKLSIYSGQEKINEVEVSPTTLLRFVLSDTVVGDKFYRIKINYPYNSQNQRKDYSKPSGMQLSGDMK